MDLKTILARFLNPKSNLEKLRQTSEGSAPAGARGRLRAGDVLTNVPLMMGAIIVLGLFLLVLFGPVWAPKNPYIAAQHIMPHYNFSTKEFISPPLPPSDEYPLGTDRWGNCLLSLLMHGARNTLVACAFVTMVRVFLGLALGGLAGWNEGKAADQIVMGAIGVINSVPMLISGMLLIYALDIRRGLPVFIVALSAIGWTEIAQYIRSEFLVLRKMSYIEGARAAGLTELAIAVRHIVPNILPQLLVITFLEMGAVMMLLGELGFVGVYIGGGTQFANDDPFAFQVFTLVDVPEWGAMLAEGFRWLRSKPFVVLPPAIAFFVSVVGFNSLGEGLRHLIEKAGVNTAFLLKKRMLIVVGVLVLATVFIINNTGAAPWFSKVAQAFSGDVAYQHVEALAAMDGRGAGQEGGQQAAEYVAAQFEAYGLQPGGKHNSYVHPLETQLVRPLEQPSLVLLDAGASPQQVFRHQLDFGFEIEGHGGSGEAAAPLTFVGFRAGQGSHTWESFKGLDLRDRIVIAVRRDAPPGFATEALIRGARGVLWIAGDGRDDVRSQVQLGDPEGEYVRQPSLPVFRIRPAVAYALLEQAGVTLSDLEAPDAVSDQSGPGWYTHDLDVSVRMSLSLSEPQDVEIPCVLGYMPGSDFSLAHELLVLFVAYDGLGVDPDGTIYPAANHNASGLGLLLEVARLWQEQDLDARRSVMFVAWGGGQLQNPGAIDFIENPHNFRHLLAPVGDRVIAPAIVVQPDYAGAGGDALFVHPRSDARLQEMLEEASATVGISVASQQVDVPDFDYYQADDTRWVYLSWQDPEIAPDQDLFARIEKEKLQALGEALSLVLTQLVRQVEY